MLNLKRSFFVPSIDNFPLNFPEHAIQALATASPEEITKIYFELGLYYSCSNLKKASKYFWQVLEQGTDRELQAEAARLIEAIDLYRFRKGVKKIRKKIRLQHNSRRARKIFLEKITTPQEVHKEIAVFNNMSLWELVLSLVYHRFLLDPYPDTPEEVLSWKKEVARCLEQAIYLKPELERLDIDSRSAKQFHQLHDALKRASRLFEE